MKQVLVTEIDLLEVYLRHGICKVTFEKKDGTVREMTCTKDTLQIPQDRAPKGVREPKEGIMTVWDLDKEDWRSFVRDNVKGWVVVK